ncbi:MAG: hypothetical protein AAGF12_13135 [Myxococcota bacterium]
MLAPGHGPIRTPKPLVRACLALILGLQFFVCFQGLGQLWHRGHNGWNGAAYHLAARNSLRWGQLFPVQYDASPTEPTPDKAYTHAPLGLHLHGMMNIWLLGDHEASLRLIGALWSLLAAIAMFLMVRELWGEGHGLLAVAIYVLLPINLIYANMPAHPPGYIACSLLAFLFYARYHGAREGPNPEQAFRPLLAMYGCFFVATLWDWPAYLLAPPIAIHWFVVALVRLSDRNAANPRWYRSPDLWALLGFHVVTLGSFGGHFLLIQTQVGDLSEVMSTASNRQEAGGNFEEHLRQIPELMFTWPMLALGVTWFISFFVRAADLRLRRRDLIPFAYGMSGIIYYIVFKNSAMVHSYWGWSLLPFVAIAGASVLGRLIEAPLRVVELPAPWRERVGIGLGAILFAVPILGPLLIRDVQMVPPAREAGGSMWFVEPISNRGPVQTYQSGRGELRFATKVRSWTTRRTGVLVHRDFDGTIPEYRWETTLDRLTRRVVLKSPSPPPPDPGASDGWVLVGMVSSLTELDKRRLAEAHPYVEYDRYFFCDFRTSGTDVKVISLVPETITPWHWFWDNPHEGPVTEIRRPDLEGAILASLAEPSS